MSVSIPELVRRDLLHREKTDTEHLGAPSQHYSGPEGILDAYDDALSLACYLRQVIEEMTTTDAPPSIALLLPQERI